MIVVKFTNCMSLYIGWQSVALTKVIFSRGISHLVNVIKLRRK